jgi:hypothetical protein
MYLGLASKGAAIEKRRVVRSRVVRLPIVSTDLPALAILFLIDSER